MCNRSTDVLFFGDMILQFFLAYQESPARGGRWVTSRKLIGLHYVRTWFFIDLISVLPFDLVTFFEFLPLEGESSMLRAVRVIRLVRLVKLLRILRASRIIARWQSYFGIPFAQVRPLRRVAASRHGPPACRAHV